VHIDQSVIEVQYDSGGEWKSELIWWMGRNDQR